MPVIFLRRWSPTWPTMRFGTQSQRRSQQLRAVHARIDPETGSRREYEAAKLFAKLCMPFYE
jgi:hypothetical protein